MTSKRRKGEREAASAIRRARMLADVDPCDPAAQPPPGSVPADPAQLAHNNTYGPLPRFYVDRLIVCRTCGTEEVWTAERQKWWYETAKGGIFTEAVHCRSCRETEKTRRAEARRIHQEGLARKRRHRKGTP